MKSVRIYQCPKNSREGKKNETNTIQFSESALLNGKSACLKSLSRRYTSDQMVRADEAIVFPECWALKCDLSQEEEEEYSPKVIYFSPKEC